MAAEDFTAETDLLARRAGLGRALRLFPDAVADAVRTAAAARQALGGELAPHCEPFAPPAGGQ